MIGLKKKSFIFLSLLWIAFIFYNSLQSAPESSEISGRFVKVLQYVLSWIGIIVDPSRLSLFIRKAAHLFEFFILTILAFPVVSDNKKCHVLVFLYGIIIAIIDEMIQFFSPGRCSSAIDVLIDLGGVCGAIFFRLIINKKR